MAPNANTHLLSAREQMYAAGGARAGAGPARAPLPDPAPLPEPGGLQLDLGDGATHTPRPGSRAQRAARRELPTAREVRRGGGGERGGGGGGGERGGDDDELRAAYELSARVYGGGSIRRLPRPADLLPDEYGMRSRASPSPSALSVAGSGSLSLGGGSLALGGGSLALGGGSLSLSGGELRLGGAALTLGGQRRLDRHTPPPRHPRGGGVGVGMGVGGGRSPSPRRSPRALSALYSPHHSRGHSPNYA